MPRKVEIQFLIDYGSALPTEQIKVGELTIEEDGTISGQFQPVEEKYAHFRIISSLLASPRPLIFAAIFMPTPIEILESFANQEEPS